MYESFSLHDTLKSKKHAEINLIVAFIFIVILRCKYNKIYYMQKFCCMKFACLLCLYKLLYIRY